MALAPWRSGTPISRGTVLAGKYRLELLLGEGGMGFVWSAYNLELELPVAIKLLRAGPEDERLAERLRFEARAAARLVHPAIVRIFDIATTAEGAPFIVMELLTGESLAELLGRGALSCVRAVQLMLPIAEALALAHAKGIVHRDLKPGNVLLSTDGPQLQPKLLDFGIAKLNGHQPGVGKLTAKGAVIGSPNYMSPEQVRGEDVDYRSDIWSFCVVLYRAISGSTPFKGHNRLAIMDSIISDEPAPLAIGAGVDQQLARLIRWGMTKDPGLRPTSIQELGRQLAEWLVAQGVSEDACGTPVASKWLTHLPDPSMRRPPPLPELLAERDAQAAVTLESPARKLSLSQAAQVYPVARRAAPVAPVSPLPFQRRRRWALFTSASMLLVAAGIAWTDSVRHPGARQAMATPRPPNDAGRAPAVAQLRSSSEILSAASRDDVGEKVPAPAAGVAEPPLVKESEAAPAPKSRRRPAPRLPF